MPAILWRQTEPFTFPLRFQEAPHYKLTKCIDRIIRGFQVSNCLVNCPFSKLIYMRLCLHDLDFHWKWG